MTYRPYAELQRYDDELLAEFANMPKPEPESRPEPVKVSALEALEFTASDAVNATRAAAEREAQNIFEELVKTSGLRRELADIREQRDPVAYLAAAQASKE